MSAECGEPGPEGPQGPSPGPGGLPGASGLGQCPPRTTSAPWSLPLWRAHAAAAVLCYVNLLNYMHWFIIPGEGGRASQAAPAVTHGSRPPAGAVDARHPPPSKLSSRGDVPATLTPGGGAGGFSQARTGEGGIEFPIQPQTGCMHTAVGAGRRWVGEGSRAKAQRLWGCPVRVWTAGRQPGPE